MVVITIKHRIFPLLGVLLLSTLNGCSADSIDYDEYRITGGSQAPLGKYPYFVHGDGCGGTLIHPDIVLTAAHCLGAFSEYAIVGAYKRGALDGGAEQITTLAEIRHPGYNSNEDYDAMIVVLSSPSQKTPIQLNTSPAVPKGKGMVKAIGMGQINKKRSVYAPYLQETHVKTLKSRVCVKRYKKGWITPKIQICTIATGPQDTCFGDSGGPIMTKTNVQVGIVSWGSSVCADPWNPGVYTRVSAIMPWIREQICTFSAIKPAYCPA